MHCGPKAQHQYYGNALGRLRSTRSRVDGPAGLGRPHVASTSLAPNSPGRAPSSLRATCRPRELGIATVTIHAARAPRVRATSTRSGSILRKADGGRDVEGRHDRFGEDDCPYVNADRRRGRQRCLAGHAPSEDNATPSTPGELRPQLQARSTIRQGVYGLAMPTIGVRGYDRRAGGGREQRGPARRSEQRTQMPPAADE